MSSKLCIVNLLTKIVVTDIFSEGYINIFIGCYVINVSYELIGVRSV